MSFAHDGLHDDLTRLAAPPHFKEIVQKIHADVAKAFAQPELVARFVERSIELVTSPSPEDFGQLIRSEVARLGKVAREAGIKAE